MSQLANFLTVLSLLCGFVSVIFSLEGHFTFACWAIVLSVIFDGLDGQIARWNNQSTDFGKELDSLVDVVAFGIAPSILGYIFVYRHFHLWATVALFIYLFASVLRLAKYNITPKEKLGNYFFGLPTTASGGIIASFILIYRKYTQLPPPLIFLLIVMVLAFLMISKLKYPNLDGLVALLGKKIFFILVPAAAAMIFVPEIALIALFLLYLTCPAFLGRAYPEL